MFSPLLGTALKTTRALLGINLLLMVSLAQAGGLALTVSVEGNIAHLTLENRTADKLTVLAVETIQKKDSPVVMTLRSKFRSLSETTTMVPVPYLVIEALLKNKESCLYILPDEAGSKRVNALGGSALYHFMPGENIARTLEFPAAPVELAVHYFDSGERQRMQVLRWKAPKMP